MSVANALVGARESDSDSSGDESDTDEEDDAGAGPDFAPAGDAVEAGLGAPAADAGQDAEATWNNQCPRLEGERGDLPAGSAAFLRHLGKHLTQSSIQHTVIQVTGGKLIHVGLMLSSRQLTMRR